MPVDEDAGIRVLEGFDAKVFAEGVGRARHIAVRDNGDVYVALRRPTEGSGIAALRDQDGDGAAERIESFGAHAGTGIAIHDGFLYASSDLAIHRYPLPEGEALVPAAAPETVVEGFPEQRSHASKAFTIDGSGNLYVNVGAPSNACQEQDRTLGSPGQQPCPLLENHAGIWRFDAGKTDQTFEDGERFVTGTRYIVALDWNPEVGELYFVMHGRDQLHDLFPDLYTVEESAELPAEELHVVREGANYGWPYTYFDHEAKRRVIAPEYGGDGETAAEEGKYQAPLLTFPGHWAPNDLLFYTAEEGFPAEAQRRRVHYLPRLLEPRAAAAAGLQRRVRAVPGRRVHGRMVRVRRRLQGRRDPRGLRRRRIPAHGPCRRPRRCALHRRFGPGPDLARDHDG